MKKGIIIIGIVAFMTACSDDVELSMKHVQQNEIEEIKEFIIPDTINVQKELVIAAYYEIHPKKACVIIAYKDTSRTAVKRYSYSSDSSFVVKELVSVNYNEFKEKEVPSVSYLVKPSSVVWTLQRGNTAATAEFERIDQIK